MPQRTPRPFRLAEALFLVAAAAVGLAWCRLQLTVSEGNWRELWHSLASGGLTRRGLVEGWAAVTLAGGQLASAILLPVTFATLALRLLGPPPKRRHLWSQPGFLTGVAVAFAVGWPLIGFVASIALELAGTAGAVADPWTLATELAVLASCHVVVRADAGGTVALLWLVAAASGRWWPEPSGLDRVGRGLGVIWVILSVLSWPTVLLR
jgi:hypothetical protein